MVEVHFLGSGNAFCPTGRMHSLVLIDGGLLVDAPPTLLAQLRIAGISPDEIDDLCIRINCGTLLPVEANIVVTLDGGLVQGIAADRPITVRVVDYDVDDAITREIARARLRDWCQDVCVAAVLRA